jgi:uncharacterized membrane protein
MFTLDATSVAILGLAMTFIFWGVDKLVDPLERYPRRESLQTMTKYILKTAGIIYFIGGLILLYLIGIL